MKKILFFVLLTCLSLSASAQFMTKSYMPGTVVFTDGHEQTYPLVQIPGGTFKNLEVYSSENKKDADKTTLEFEDIFCLKFWDNEHPETITTIYRVKMEKVAWLNTNQWGMPIAASDWGVVFKCYPGYKKDKKTGELLGLVYYSQGTETPTPCLLLLKGEDEAHFVAQQFSGGKTQWSDLTGKRMIKLLDSNPKLAEQIKKKKIHAGDLQYILDQMAQ